MKYLVIIILILILFILIYLNKTYRLGDYIRGTGFEFKNKIIRRLYPQLHKNTLVYKYYKETLDYSNFDVLQKITKGKKLDILTIHLRLGDVIDNHPRSVLDFLSKDIKFKKTDPYLNVTGDSLFGNKSEGYVKNLKYYKNIINKINKYKIKDILLISGSHLKTINPNKSQLYLKYIKDFFIKNGFNVKIRWNHNPDEDFKIMCNSKYFTPSGGGFSHLIENVSRLNNNIIIK